MGKPVEEQRSIGLASATSLGVGAIVGGGILALTGTAFATTGAGALLAFALNGVIAVITALSFAELSTTFPQSGGTYVFARRVLSVGAAFMVGWVVWFASIVSGALYAIGFGAFAAHGLVAGAAACGFDPARVIDGDVAAAVSATLAVVVCGGFVCRTTRGGGDAVNVIKLVVFGILILGGVWVWLTSETSTAVDSPLLPLGTTGLLQAMGYTFIALQGFDLIAAVAGEVRDPRRTLPRSMLMALGIALLVYLPLLLVILLVGIPGGTDPVKFARENQDTLVAVAARNFLGPSGFWLVIAAGVLSMFSALLANVFAAARIAQAMAHHRTLPAGLETIDAARGTPAAAGVVTTILVVGLVVLVGDVAAAGAAASLIFLITFGLAHVLCILARRRRPNHSGFRAPLWPWLPALGACACGGLAVFQGVVVPSAGIIAGVWMLAGGAAYLWRFGRHARISDAVSEASDPDLIELRGRSPLVLVPIANPNNAGVMALVAGCMTPPRVGRVLLLNVVPPLQSVRPEDVDRVLGDASTVMRESLGAALRAGVRAEALATVGVDPWQEIERAALLHRCATLLLGMTVLSDAALRGHIELLASRVSCNIVVFRAPPGWRPEQTRRVLVPVGGGGGAHGSLRARLLTSLRHRAAPDLEVTFQLILPATTSAPQRRRVEQAYARVLRDEFHGPATIAVVLDDDVGRAIEVAAAESDLLILGLHRMGRGRRVFGETTRKVIATTECAAMVISEGG